MRFGILWMVIALSGLALAGCMTDDEHHQLPDGTVQYSLTTKTGLFAPPITTVYRDMHNGGPMQLVTAAGAQPPETAILGGAAAGLTTGLGPSLFFRGGGGGSVGSIVNQDIVNVGGANVNVH